MDEKKKRKYALEVSLTGESLSRDIIKRIVSCTRYLTQKWIWGSGIQN